jgi:hypothetical protein
VGLLMLAALERIERLAPAATSWRDQLAPAS